MSWTVFFTPSHQTMKILPYVHLRNIHGSTGAGRLARYMVEHLCQFPENEIVVLADPRDYRKIIPLVGSPWANYSYRFFRHETSIQQLIWLATDRPVAESYWPEVEVVYCTGESYVPTKRARLAVTAHDAALFEEGAHRQDASTFRQRFKWKLLYSKLGRKADSILTVSHFSAGRLAHYFPGLRSRLRVVPSAVPPRFFEPPSQAGEAELANFGLLGRQFVLLSGGLNFRKNADLVLRAWPLLSEKYPDLLLVIPGYCEPGYVEMARPLESSVRILGFTSDELLCSLYHAATVVWFPSLYEGFGLPPLEAMACGTPVVASNTSSIPEVVGDAAFFVSPHSVAENVEGLEAIIQSGGAEPNMVQRGRTRAAQFTWKNAAEKLNNELKRLA